MILCAGYATRLYPLTLERPKALLPVGGKPIANYLLDRLAGLPGVQSVVLVTNEKFKQQFFSWKDRLSYGKPLDIVVDPSTNEANRLGAIKDLELVISTMGLREDLLVLAGDNLFDFDLTDFLQRSFERRPAITIGIVRMESPEKASRYGVVRHDEANRIVEFYEKPEKPETPFVSTGIYFLPEEKIPLVRAYLVGRENPDAPGHFITWVSKREAVYTHLFVGTWYDIGDRATYKHADEVFGQRGRRG